MSGLVNVGAAEDVVVVVASAGATAAALPIRPRAATRVFERAYGRTVTSSLGGSHLVQRGSPVRVTAARRGICPVAAGSTARPHRRCLSQASALRRLALR